MEGGQGVGGIGDAIQNGIKRDEKKDSACKKEFYEEVPYKKTGHKTLYKNTGLEVNINKQTERRHGMGVNGDAVQNTVTEDKNIESTYKEGLYKKMLYKKTGQKVDIEQELAENKNELNSKDNKHCINCTRDLLEENIAQTDRITINYNKKMVYKKTRLEGSGDEEVGGLDNIVGRGKSTGVNMDENADQKDRITKNFKKVLYKKTGLEGNDNVGNGWSDDCCLVKGGGSTNSTREEKTDQKDRSTTKKVSKALYKKTGLDGKVNEGKNWGEGLDVNRHCGEVDRQDSDNLDRKEGVNKFYRFYKKMGIKNKDEEEEKTEYKKTGLLKINMEQENSKQTETVKERKHLRKTKNLSPSLNKNRSLRMLRNLRNNGAEIGNEGNSRGREEKMIYDVEKSRKSSILHYLRINRDENLPSENTQNTFLNKRSLSSRTSKQSAEPLHTPTRSQGDCDSKLNDAVISTYFSAKKRKRGLDIVDIENRDSTVQDNSEKVILADNNQIKNTVVSDQLFTPKKIAKLITSTPGSDLKRRRCSAGNDAKKYTQLSLKHYLAFSGITEDMKDNGRAMDKKERKNDRDKEKDIAADKSIKKDKTAAQR